MPPIFPLPGPGTAFCRISGRRLVPAGLTEFARDKSFGYRSSDLRSYITEKSGGTFSAPDCLCITFDELRSTDYGSVTRKLMSEKNYIARSAASLAMVAGNIPPARLLTKEQLAALDSFAGGRTAR